MVLLMAVVRRCPGTFDAACGETWATGRRFRGHQILGKTWGIIGYGGLGPMVPSLPKPSACACWRATCGR